MPVGGRGSSADPASRAHDKRRASHESSLAASFASSSVVRYDAGTRTATLNPSANLAAGTPYTVGLAGSATAIRDAAGNPLTTLTWSFTTR